MRWTAPLERRELMLVLFSLAVFSFSYNIDNSIRLLGLDPEAAHGVVSSTLGFGNSKLIGKDGRKPAGWRDALEAEIFGPWGWDEGHVAGDGAERSQLKDTGKYGALWAGQKETGDVRNKFLGESTVNEGFLKWGDDIPQSKVVRHTAGASSVAACFCFKKLSRCFSRLHDPRQRLYLEWDCVYRHG
jgi:hypothetical protein